MNTARKLTSPIVVIVLCSAFALLSILATAPCVLAEDAPTVSPAWHNAPSDKSTPEMDQHSSCCGVGDTHGLSWVDQNVPAKAQILCIHGLGLCARAYEEFGKRMSQKGIAVYAIDVRGFGPRSHKPEGKKLDLNKAVEDVRAVLDSIHCKHPDRPIFLVGESMGGSIAIRTAALYPNSMSGLICSAPAWRLYKQNTTALKGLVGLVIQRNCRVGFAATGVIKQATTSASLRQHWLEDDAHKLELSPGEALSFIRFIHRTPHNSGQIASTPVLVIQGLHDHLVKPEGAAGLIRRLPTANKTFAIDCSAEHLILEEGQFSDEALMALSSWIDNQIAHPNRLAPETLPVGMMLGASKTISPSDERAARALFGRAGCSYSDKTVRKG